MAARLPVLGLHHSGKNQYVDRILVKESKANAVVPSAKLRDPTIGCVIRSESSFCRTLLPALVIPAHFMEHKLADRRYKI